VITAELDRGHTLTLLEAAPHAGTADEDDEDHREKGYQLEVDEDEEREANSDSYDVAEGSYKDDVEPKEQPTRAQMPSRYSAFRYHAAFSYLQHIFSSGYIRRFLFPALKE
jgi:hypothetical protein